MSVPGTLHWVWCRLLYWVRHQPSNIENSSGRLEVSYRAFLSLPASVKHVYKVVLCSYFILRAWYSIVCTLSGTDIKYEYAGLCSFQRSEYFIFQGNFISHWTRHSSFFHFSFLDFHPTYFLSSKNRSMRPCCFLRAKVRRRPEKAEHRAARGCCTCTHQSTPHGAVAS